MNLTLKKNKIQSGSKSPVSFAELIYESSSMADSSVTDQVRIQITEVLREKDWDIDCAIWAHIIHSEL